MKKLIIISLFCFSALILAEPADAALTCLVRSGGCLSGETAVFKMSNNTNAHAELSGQANYNYYVCCSGVTGLGNSCSGNFATVLRLSSVTNAHVERSNYSPQNYSNYACLSVPSGPDISCIYETGGCSGGYAGLASISGDTNAHVGDYNNYSTKVCCTVTEECIRTDPSVSLSPSRHYGEPGDPKEYAVEIINNDNALCGNSTFNITNPDCPAGWTCARNKTSVTISPGATDTTVTLTVTSSASATAADYTVSVRATNSGATSYFGTGSAIYTVLDPEVFDFNIWADPASGSVVAGNEVNTTIYLGLLSGEPQLVTLSASDLPPGATVGFYSNGTYSDSCSPNCSRRMNVFVPSGTTPGDYRIKITGTGGGKSHDAYYDLIVLAPEEFEFSIVTEPTSGSVARNSQVSTNVEITRTQGTAENVGFWVSNLPSGITSNFSPPNCTPSDICNSTLILSAASDAQLVTNWPVEVCGTADGGFAICTTYNLTVTEAGEAINAPQVTTDRADNVTQTSATLIGTLNNMGGASSVIVWFEYKKRTDTTWIKVCEETKNSIGSFSPCNLTGLTANTTYDFQAFAKNGGSW